jgi:hypothetical protein
VLVSTSGLTRSRVRLKSVGIAILIAVVACGTGAVPAPASAPDGLLVRQLTREVTDAGALMHLQALQKIADEHGGNRAAGTRGYEASVDYVVARQPCKAYERCPLQRISARQLQRGHVRHRPRRRPRTDPAPLPRFAGQKPPPRVRLHHRCSSVRAPRGSTDNNG